MSDFNGTYELDPTHTRIGFVARHAMITKVRGSFDEWTSEITIDGENSVIKATIDTTSINTRNGDRDAHIKGEDFFDVEKYPEMTFVATKVDLANGSVIGDLTIKGVTKPVTLDVELAGPEVDPWGQTRVGLEATTKINRKDFGIDFQAPMNSGGVLISEQIVIELEGSAIKK